MLCNYYVISIQIFNVIKQNKIRSYLTNKIYISHTETILFCSIIIYHYKIFNKIVGSIIIY